MGLPPPPEASWVAWVCSRLQRIGATHDYRCVGLEHVPAGPAMLAGYHGRPALDSFLLGALLYQEQGRWPRGVGHRGLMQLPGLGRLTRNLGLFEGRREQMAALLDSGELLLVLPGGARECFRSSRVRYRLDWGDHQGYARRAIRHQVPVVPFATAGVDELFHVLGDGYRISRRLTGTDMLPLCLPLGHRGTLIPRPVPLHQHIGEPIAPPPDEGGLDAFDQRVRDAVSTLLARAVARPLGPREGLQLGLRKDSR